ncbi:MAG: hypothetical protein MSC30_02440 [Gaiellaceae bacterium MAG52_C11]|nr:hypothetical protein [Candidatus Gaiellasilicea maunaloa]
MILVTAVAILVLPGAALGHLSVRPGLLESGREQTLEIELPELRLGRRPSALVVSGPGVRMLARNLTGRRGEESRWRVRVDVQTEPGPVVLLLRAEFTDGRSVTLRQAMTVLPASDPPASSRPGLVAGIGVLGLLTGGAALVLLRRARFE